MSFVKRYSSLTCLGLLAISGSVLAHPGHIHGPADHPTEAIIQTGTSLLAGLTIEALLGMLAGVVLAVAVRALIRRRSRPTRSR